MVQVLVLGVQFPGYTALMAQVVHLKVLALDRELVGLEQGQLWILVQEWQLAA